ncbi:unnamed protein product, partial [Mesorhabditis spiculigera]
MATSGELHALDSKNGLRSVNVACKLMGTFGEHLKSIKAVAKRIHLEYSPSKVKSVTNQLWLLQSQANKNPYIVSYYGSFYEDQDGKPSDLWLLFERMDCDLRHYLNHLKRYDGMENERKRDFRHVSSFMVQMLRALDFLHSNGIVHGGIRPEKIGLQKQQYTLKLLSFGASRKNPLTGKPMRSECPEYDPPETLLEENVNSKMDIWAVGVCAVEFLGISPFTLEHPENYHRSVSSLATWKQILARYTDVAPETNILSAGIIENTPMNFEKLHAKIPYHRLGEDVGPLTVAAFRQILESILVINPSRRSSAAECLKMEFLSEMNVEKIRDGRAGGKQFFVIGCEPYGDVDNFAKLPTDILEQNGTISLPEHLGKKDLSDQPVKRDIRHLGALLTQILHAIEFLHNTGIIHRDITPRNIGMNQKEFVIKLLDFGLARDILPNNDYTINVDTPPIYKAPEALVQEISFDYFC